MAFDLVETLKNLFNTEFAGRAASQLGESESGIQKALGGIIPTVLTGLLQKQGPETRVDCWAWCAMPRGRTWGNWAMLPAGCRQVCLPKAPSSCNPCSAINRPTSRGHRVLRGYPPTIGRHAYAGNRARGAGRHRQSRREHRPGASGIVDLLVSQKDKILAAVPSGLGLAGLLGAGSLGDIGNRLSSLAGSVKTTANSVGHAADHTVHEAAAGGGRWVTWLIIAIAGILLLWWLLRGCGAKEKMTVVESDSITVIEDTHSSTPAAAPVVRESIKVTLPDGKVLDAYKGGIEDQLVQFLQDPASQAGKDVWFDFDNLNFQTGSAQITPESQVQIDNLAAILNAFPKAKIKIGGYTDATGDAKKNQQLSQERATSVVTALSAANVKPVQLQGAEGYGSQFAKAAPDAPDEERKKDRRISVSVREK